MFFFYLPRLHVWAYCLPLVPYLIILLLETTGSLHDPFVTSYTLTLTAQALSYLDQLNVTNVPSLGLSRSISDGILGIGHSPGCSGHAA